jgi:WD40 repeat protein
LGDGIGSGLNEGVLLPGGALAALGRYDRKVLILDLTTGKLQDEPVGHHSDSISQVYLCPNKREIMSTSRDGSARFWNIEDRLRNAPSAEQVLIRARNSGLA